VSDTFARLTVETELEECRIDLAVDVRMRPVDRDPRVALLSLEELAADDFDPRLVSGAFSLVATHHLDTRRVVTPLPGGSAPMPGSCSAVSGDDRGGDLGGGGVLVKALGVVITTAYITGTSTRKIGETAARTARRRVRREGRLS
jgi:hypothetical protein